jgi:hypothetical protein
MAAVGMVISMIAYTFAQVRSANERGCALIDKHHPAQFILYEGRSQTSSEIKLRLRNNTDCAIIVETDDVFPTQLKRLPNGGIRIETVLGSQDELRLRLHYLIENRQRRGAPEPAYGWGDSVFTYRILEGHSVIFTVPVSHFKRGFDIAVPFNYSWEGVASIGTGAGGVVHLVYFLSEDLPKAALRTKR